MKNKKNLCFLVLSLSVLNFVACNEHDTSYEYYDSDHKKLYKKYKVNKKTGKMDGTYKEFYENGTLKIETAYKNDEMDGLYKAFYDDGTLMNEGTYKNGKKDGLYKNFDGNGTLRDEGIYKNDEKNGYYRVMRGDGTLRIDATYKNGELDGPYKQFYENGNLEIDAVYKEDKKNGYYRVMDEDGTLRIDAVYKNDEKDGVYKEFDAKVTLWIEISYTEGHLDGPYEVYDGNGNLVAKGRSSNVGFDHTHFFTDPRDSQSYPIVTIGKQVWMAENLNYKMSFSYCFNDEKSNCDKFGRLYKWRAAEKACPAGWHLPSKKEYEILLETVGTQKFAGVLLKSANGWLKNGNGLDAFGFSALPAGYMDDKGDYISLENTETAFWSSTETGGYNANEFGINYGEDFHAYYMNLLDMHEGAGLGRINKNYMFSVRCVNDYEAIPKMDYTNKELDESDGENDVGSVNESRSAEDIMEIVNKRTPGLEKIYNKFLEKRNGFAGKVSLKFTIAPSGKIISISIASSTTGYSEFDSEIKNAVSRWTFNKVKSGNTTVTIPFTFSE